MLRAFSTPWSLDILEAPSPFLCRKLRRKLCRRSADLCSNHRITTHELKTHVDPLNSCAGAEPPTASQGRWHAVVDPSRFDKVSDKASDEGESMSGH